MKLREMDNIRAWICKKGPGERGIALISVILLIMVLSFVSAATIVTSITELKIGGNFKTSVQALYNAEAGWQYALGQIRNQYSAGTLDPTGSSVLVRYLPPDTSVHPQLPFSNWSNTRLTLKPGTTSDYTFPATGYYANSNTSIQVLLRMPPPPLVKGMFAANSLTVGPNQTCSGEVGSNSASVTTAPDVCTMSHLALPINSDPLGASSQISEASKYLTSNNNANAVPSISGNTFTGGENLPPGNYYLTDLTNGDLTISGIGAVNIYVANSLSLTKIRVNAGSGPLKIFYHGTSDVDIPNHSTLNYVTTPPPPPPSAGNLAIISDTTAKFNFGEDCFFSGLLYAPMSDKFAFQPNDNVNGLLWGKNIDLKNKMDFRYDPNVESLYKKLLGPEKLSWKQL